MGLVRHQKPSDHRRSCRRYAHGITTPLVLCYHAVSDKWESPLAVSREALRRQLSLLLDRGYKGTTFTAAITGKSDARTVAVTFDDGYRSVFEHAFPVLAEFGLPGTVFIPTGFVGWRQPMAWPGIEQWATGAHAEELVPMSWDNLRSLVTSGWEVGSHSVSHPRLTTVPDAVLRAELDDSRDECEQRLQTRCRSLAYPYGDHDRRVVEAAGQAGYDAAAVLDRTARAPRPLAWPRVGIYGADSHGRFRLKVSSLTRSRAGSAAVVGLNLLRRRLPRSGNWPGRPSRGLPGQATGHRSRRLRPQGGAGLDRTDGC